MARFNFRIGTKLGLTAGIGVVLVGGMLANQLVGNQSVATLSTLVISNYSNKSNAQTTDSAMMRAQLAVRDIAAARSAAEIDESLRNFSAIASDAGAQIDAAAAWNLHMNQGFGCLAAWLPAAGHRPLRRGAASRLA